MGPKQDRTRYSLQELLDQSLPVETRRWDVQSSPTERPPHQRIEKAIVDHEADASWQLNYDAIDYMAKSQEDRVTSGLQTKAIKSEIKHSSSGQRNPPPISVKQLDANIVLGRELHNPKKGMTTFEIDILRPTKHARKTREQLDAEKLVPKQEHVSFVPKARSEPRPKPKVSQEDLDFLIEGAWLLEDDPFG